MRNLLNFLFEKIPYLEVICRRLFYFFKKDHETNKTKKKKKRQVKIRQDAKNFFINTIRSFDIKKGDVLIVHSGYSELKVTGLTISEIINFLMELIGENGTLVMPAYPDYSTQKIQPFIYDVGNSKSWTGAIPNYFCSFLKAKRSLFPNNPLACFGQKTSLILESNLKAVYPHGKDSAWYNCVQQHAKILFIGTNIAHSNTLVHVAEDILGDNFPIKGWYESVSYEVVSDGNVLPISIKQRKQFWSRFIDENRNTWRLKKKGLAVEYFKFKMHIGFINDSFNVASEILERASQAKLEYKIPKKYWIKK